MFELQVVSPAPAIVSSTIRNTIDLYGYWATFIACLVSAWYLAASGHWRSTWRLWMRVSGTSRIKGSIAVIVFMASAIGLIAILLFNLASSSYQAGMAAQAQQSRIYLETGIKVSNLKPKLEPRFQLTFGSIGEAVIDGFTSHIEVIKQPYPYDDTGRLLPVEQTKISQYDVAPSQILPHMPRTISFALGRALTSEEGDGFNKNGSWLLAVRGSFRKDGGKAEDFCKVYALDPARPLEFDAFQDCLVPPRSLRAATSVIVGATTNGGTLQVLPSKR